MARTYTPSEAAKSTGVSASSVRNYSKKYPDQFSEGADPAPGQARAYTFEDLRTIAFIAEWSKNGETYEEIGQRLESGEQSDYSFSGVFEEKSIGGDDQVGPDPATATAIVQVFAHQLQIAQERERTLYETMLRQEQEARQREADLQSRLQATSEEKGKLSGELEETRRQLDELKNRSFWAKLFGG